MTISIVRAETYSVEPYRVGSAVLDYEIGYRALRDGADLGLYRARAEALRSLDARMPLLSELGHERL